MTNLINIQQYMQNLKFLFYYVQLKDFINSKKDYLESFGINVDYLISCDPESFKESYEIHNKNLLIAIAAYVGKVRLIDNLKLTKL